MSSNQYASPVAVAIDFLKSDTYQNSILTQQLGHTVRTVEVVTRWLMLLATPWEMNFSKGGGPAQVLTFLRDALQSGSLGSWQILGKQLGESVSTWGETVEGSSRYQLAVEAGNWAKWLNTPLVTTEGTSIQPITVRNQYAHGWQSHFSETGLTNLMNRAIFDLSERLPILTLDVEVVEIASVEPSEVSGDDLNGHKTYILKLADSDMSAFPFALEAEGPNVQTEQTDSSAKRNSELILLSRYSKSSKYAEFGGLGRLGITKIKANSGGHMANPIPALSAIIRLVPEEMVSPLAQLRAGVLVGRDEELSTALDRIADEVVLTGSKELLVLEAEPGAGKTAFLSEVAHILSMQHREIELIGTFFSTSLGLRNPQEVFRRMVEVDLGIEVSNYETVPFEQKLSYMLEAVSEQLKGQTSKQLILVDGLDEISTDKRFDVIGDTVAFLEGLSKLGIVVLVSVRTGTIRSWPNGTKPLLMRPLTRLNATQSIEVLDSLLGETTTKLEPTMLGEVARRSD